MKKFTLNVMIIALAVFTGINVSAQNVIDLTGIDNPNILVDTLPDIPNGAVVNLKPGMIYNAGGYAFDKSVTIQSSEPLNDVMPLIDCASNFNFAADAMVDSIIFKNIEIFGTFDARYVLNSNVAATIGELRFESCYIHNLRGVLRMKDAGPGTLEKYTIVDCVVDSIRDYGILTVDMADWACNYIHIKNSTISKVRAFITNKNNSDSVLVENSTISHIPATGQRLFRWRESGQDNVWHGITIRNTLWGPGWDETNSGDTGYDGFDGLADTEWTFENNYATNDLSFAAGKDTIHGLLENVYDGPATTLWVDPMSGDFHFNDLEFEGIGTAGDPRWAPVTPVAGSEWNISLDAFNALGDVAETTTIEGLTIFAAADKLVSVDANDKELDDMTFTHRLKLGGSGGFDENGLPLNRVLSFDVTGNTKITVAAMSSSGSADRILNIATGHKDSILAEFPALGASLTKGVYNYVGDSTKIFLYSPSSGVNVYYIKAEPLTTEVNQVYTERNEVNVYPNPATDKVYIDYNQPIQVAVYNMSGSLLKSKMIQSKYDYISIGDLQPGIYLIRSQNDNSFAKKLIKK